MTVSFTKIHHDATTNFTSYEFDLTADAYYPAPFTDYTADSADDIYSIIVFLELEPGRSFSGDIVCENCDEPSAPYFWFHDYFGAHFCFSHLPESTQTEILAQIKNL